MRTAWLYSGITLKMFLERKEEIQFLLFFKKNRYILQLYYLGQGSFVTQVDLAV